jgi:ribosomal protein S18 acetylase RimI-like enzyme
MNTATSIDVDRAIGVITSAFSADPIARWAYPDPHAYWEHFPEFVRAFAGGAFEADAAYVSEDYAGVALWLPPGVHADADALGMIVQETVPEELLDPLVEMIELQAESHPEGPHWYLPLIGVDPAHQGEGHGSRLLSRGLADVDREGLPAYLEATTPASRALYERFGFEVVREIQVPGAPPMWPMLRNPGGR